MLNNHQYIIFSQTPRTGSMSQASLLICNQVFNRELSLNQWQKDKNLYNIHGKDIANNYITSKPLNYIQIAKFMRRRVFRCRCFSITCF